MLKHLSLLFALCSILLASSCLGDLNPDEESPCLPDNLRTLYENDAIRLALRLQQNSAFANDIQIPSNSIERLQIALAAVHQSKIDERDSVISNYQIHTLPYPVFDELTVEIDTTQAWTQAWRNGSRLTGNNDIDNLLLAYGLQLDGYFSLSNNFVILTTTDHEALNLAALAARFEAVNGVLGTDFEDTGSGGNDITVQDFGTYALFAYTVGYDVATAPNACNGACEFSRTWTFKVTFANDEVSCPIVEFVSASGDPAP